MSYYFKCAHCKNDVIPNKQGWRAERVATSRGRYATKVFHEACYDEDLLWNRAWPRVADGTNSRTRR